LDLFTAKEETPSSPPKPITRRGYKVKHSAPKLTPEELKTKEDAALRMIAEAMKKRKDAF
jgi:predicted fused transcriptional regulator/phosphomethylpyrimidine kinase